MIDLDTIQTKVNLGKSYYLELLDELYENSLSGCTDCCDSVLNCLRYCINTLQYDIDTENNSDTTQATYLVLLGIIANYSGSYSPDSTVVTTTTTITVISEAEDIDKTEADLIEDGEGTDNWYLPFLDEDGNNFPDGTKPISVIYNGTSLVGWTYVVATSRIYGFTNNGAATIIVTVI